MDCTQPGLCCILSPRISTVPCASRIHRRDDVADLIRNAVERRTHNLVPSCEPRHPAEHRPRIRFPVRRAETGKRRHQIRRIRRIGCLRQRSCLPGRPDQMQVILEPGHDRAGIIDVPLQHIVDPAADLPGKRSDNSPIRKHRRLSRVHHHRGAGSVRTLRLSGRKASLPEERGMRIAEHAMDRHLPRQ